MTMPGLRDQAIQLRIFNGYNFNTINHPPYSPDLAPLNVHLFRALILAMAGKKLMSINEVECFVQNWLNPQPKKLFKSGENKLIDMWNTCLDRDGDYVE